MPTDYLEEILSGRCLDPETGNTVSVPTRSVVIERNLKGDEADLVAALDLGRSFTVVSDSNTHSAMGERVERALRSLGKVQSLRLPGTPHPDEKTAQALEKESAGTDAVIAVGSGTINDLCKYVAARTSRQCATFATAASMNGYTSVNAAITVHGHKKTLAAVAPSGVFIDLEVLMDAPAKLTQAGLGDSLCRCTAQTDWLMAAFLKNENYREFPFTILAPDETPLMAEPDALLGDDSESMRRLARVLILSGFGMTLCGGSQPASQGEHLISHYTDMMRTPGSFEDLHGRQIAVTSITMAALQQAVLDGDLPRVVPTVTSRDAVIQQFGAETGEQCRQEFAPMIAEQAEIERMNRTRESGWNEFRDRIDRVRRSSEQMKSILLRVDAPTTPEEVGWDRAFYAQVVLHAREIRNRYTFLDLAADIGKLENFVKTV